ncbi:MAG TPA: rhodanese-like domain-containing protein [Gaiellaceae bacterium]|jgi:thiosulfate/3-mercaptopyruvate sulfurtransferase
MHTVLVDCRFELGNPGRGRALYLEGHAPGAAFLDLDTELSDLSVPDAGRHPLPSAGRFAAAAGRAGIADDALVVAYGNGAPRLWWLLRHFGHDAVGVVDWRGPWRSGNEAIEPATFTPRERQGDTIQAGELLERLADPSLAILDARAPERWRGELEPIDPVAGRIPGALNAPPDAPLPDVSGREVAVYCGSGVTACATLLKLHEAGIEGRLYPGSWSEWCRRGLPGETG